MRKILLSVFLLFSITLIYAQTATPVADLLDIKFSVRKGAEDISASAFTVGKGSGVVTPIYDQSIKQYVSHYTINTSTSSANYYKVDYKGNETFKSKLKSGFTLEVYIRTSSNEDVVPVGSMYSGGFGIQQVTKGGAMQMKLGHTPKDYAYIGSKSVYSDIPEYYHVVYTYDGNNLKSYYNGILTDNVAGGTLRFSSTTSKHWIAIGGDVGASATSVEKAFSGDIALVRMYGKALTDNEVSELNKQINDRKNLVEIDVLNNLIESKLPRYISGETNNAKKNQASEFITEGQKLMQSLNTTAQDITGFASRVESSLGVKAAALNSFPRFAVVSDLHIGASYGWNDKITRAINSLDTEEEPVDAVFVVGDITNSGTSAQYKNAKTVFAQMPSSTPIYYCMGNHDWLASSTAGNNYFKNNLGQDQNQYFEIKGYPFILISMDSSNQTSGYKTATRTYLQNVLADANKKYPGKPIFLFIHIPELNTVYGSENRGMTLMNDILKGYPQVVMFTGHSHFSLRNDRAILQDKYTMIHDGGFAFARIETGNTGKVEPTSSKNFAEGCVVSVKNNGNVNVKRMDFFRNEEIKQPWVITAPHNGSNFVYTSSRTGGEKPVFDYETKPEVKVLKSTAVNVTFPQATDDELVHHYEVILTDLKGAELKSYIVWADFHLGSNQPQYITKEISPLYTYKGYKARIVAVDAYGQKSTPFDSDLFITPTGYLNVDNLYLTGTVVPGKWTVNKAEKMTEVDGFPGIFEWEGELSVGEFKFLFQNTSSKPALSATATTTIKPGTSYNTIITDGSSSKYKFKISKKGTYCVSVNVNSWIVTVTDSSGPGSPSGEEPGEDSGGSVSIDTIDGSIQNPFTIVARREGVAVVVNSPDTMVDNIELFDVSGKIVDKNRNKNATNYTIGKNITPGIYVLRINCADGPYTRKIVVE